MQCCLQLFLHPDMGTALIRVYLPHRGVPQLFVKAGCLNLTG